MLTIPPGYATDRAAPGRAAPVQLLLDGSDANTSTIALNYADAIVTRHAARAALAGRPIALPIALESRTWYNPNLESRHMIVPGLIAVIMSIIAAMLTALTIAREWERGTMEQLAATPVTRIEVVLGKLLDVVAHADGVVAGDLGHSLEEQNAVDEHLGVLHLAHRLDIVLLG
jgi:ABC-2 type transport system permease protein